MIIPISEIKKETLLNIIESFVLREGTEYGDVDIHLEDKVQQVLLQLQKGEAQIVYSELHENVDIVHKNSFL